MKNNKVDNVRAVMSLKVACNDIKNIAKTMEHECELTTHVNAVKAIINQMIDIINQSV